MKKKNSRVGVGMKERISLEQRNKAQEEVSAVAARDEGAIQSVSEPLEPVETGGEIAQESVQNLDSAEGAKEAVSVPAEEPMFGEMGTEMNPETGCISNEGLEELMQKSKDPVQQIVSECKDPNHWRNPETGMIECDDCCGRALDMERDRKKPTIAELEELMDKSGGNVRIDPDGTVTAYPIGERGDGTFGLVVTIPEGMIDPIRGQAESDRVTPEEWVSTRLGEYLDSWWSAPKGR
jgi:hypothetical protein